MKKLVIVESPNKVKSIEKYLGSDYIVKASVGHIVKLPSTGENGFGIDLETWEPKYKIDIKKRAVVKELKDAVKLVDEVYIATDPDREGEAIGDNLVEFLKLEGKYKRIRFNEITEEAVNQSIINSTVIDEKLVNSQIARRILDRIIGYKLSGLMRKKIKNTPGIPSAGRVQSIALKLVIEREKLIDAFIPIKYKTVNAVISNENQATLYLENNELKNSGWIKPQLIEGIKKQFTNKLTVDKIKITNKKEKKVTPLKQSMLYKRAHSSLGMSARAVQSAAQRLYEGYGDGGLISYPRTDSTRFSNTFLVNAKEYVLNEYGEDYLSNNVKGSSGAQDAHEAIRPVSLSLTPALAESQFKLAISEAKIYKLIWIHTMQALMNVPIRENLRYELSENDLRYKISSSKVIFDGYYIVSGYNKSKELPKFIEKQIIDIKEYLIEDHETQPPARYNDGSLIEKLDEIKVGRPSTFATTINIIKDRNYVSKESTALKPTNFGKIVHDKLIKGFPTIINEEYTAKLEKELDKIANGDQEHKKLLSEFWVKFENIVSENENTMEVTIIPLEEVDKKCPNCNSNLVRRTNKKDGGLFLACPGFPKCKHAEPDPDYKPKFKKRYTKKSNTKTT